MPATITTRQSQLSPLTHAQVDANFENLKQAIDTNSNAIDAYAQPGGAAAIGTAGGSDVQTEFDALQLADYAALRAYSGSRPNVYVTGYVSAGSPTGIAGMFVRDSTDTTSADDGIYCIVTGGGVRFKRQGGFIAAGAGAIARFPQDKARERVSVEDYYTASMGMDWTLAFQRAISDLPAGGVIEYSTPGTVGISATLVTSDAAPIVFKGKGGCTVIQKMFDGDMFNLGKKSELRDMKLDGDGATYAGRGVICQTGAVDLVSWRRIDKVEMVNMKGYPVEFTAAIAGYGTVISNSHLGAVDGTTAGVKLPDAEPNGNRQMVNVYTSGPMFNAAGCNNHYAQGCEGGAPTLSSGSVKVRMNGCRVPYSPSTPTFDVDGVDTLVTCCEIGVSAINFKSTLSYCNWYGNDDVGAAPTITDVSNGTNRIQIKRTLYTPTWAGSGTAIAQGNATIGGAWEREGDRCRTGGTLSFGNTSAVSGSNTWTMTAPYTAARNEVGSIWIQQTGTGLKQYAGSCIITAGTNKIQFNPASVTNPVGDGVPGAWVANDLLIWNVEFFIA